MTQVVFVYADWIARYPEFQAPAQGFTPPTTQQAGDLFVQATFLLSNADNSAVQDIPTRTYLLYLVTAHLAQIEFGSALQPNSALPGAIDTASEGSVSVTTKMPEQGTDAWWTVTKYGRQYLQATASYRNFQYVPGPQPRFGGRFPWLR